MNELSENYRFFSWTNMYLSDIQKGIQTAHVLGEIVSSMDQISESATEMFHTWAEDDKTIIVYNGGSSSRLKEIGYCFEADINNRNSIKYPWQRFWESDDALDGALTCVGAVLPRKLWLAANGRVSKDTMMTISIALNITMRDALIDISDGSIWKEVVAKGLTDDKDFEFDAFDVQLIELLRTSRLA